MSIRVFLFTILMLANAACLCAQSLKCSPRAKAAILFNPDTGAILYEKNAKLPYYPASTMKIASVMTILEMPKINLDQMCTASEEALRVIHADIKQGDIMNYPSYLIEHDGVVFGMQKGKQYSLESLLYVMMHISSNDAANVAAEAVGGDIDHFVEIMNQKIQETGAKETRFQNPHGLYHPAQITTAYDMALIGKWAFKHPKFVEIAHATHFDDDSYDLPIKNGNPLLKENGKYYYPKLLGGKSGYIGLAGFNLVACAEDKGRRLILVLLGSKSIDERSEDAIEIFETAFQEQPIKRRLFSKKDDAFVCRIPNSQKSFSAHLDEDVIINRYPSEDFDIATKIHWQEGLKGIKKGAQVGELSIEASTGTTLLTVPLYADASVSIQKNRLRNVIGMLELGAFAALMVLVSLQLRKKSSKLFKR